MASAGDDVFPEAQFSSQQVILSSATTRPCRDQSIIHPVKRSWKKTWRLAAIIVGVVAIGLLAATIVLVVMLGSSTAKETSAASQQQANVNKGPSTSTPTGCATQQPAIAKSCKELRQKGMKESGIKRIQPDESLPEIDTYCDMETDGGGWTLVASIHESDIRRKCYSDDLWSSYVPKEQMSYTGSTNWENEMTFGHVRTCTEDDYKNLAYYTLNASDLMVWHVQAGYHVDFMKRKSTFRYRTTNNFLQNYGGNLKELYKKHFPIVVNTVKQEMRILESITERASDIKSQLPYFHDYVAGTGTTIYDRSMFYNDGNQITYYSSQSFAKLVYYGEMFSLPKSQATITSSVSKTPFTLISAVRNDDRVTSYFEIQVFMRRPYWRSRSELVVKHENTTTLGNYRLQYKTVQFANPSYNTPCEMYFVISNPVDWKSVEPSRFRETSASYYSYYRTTRYRIEGSPVNVIFGYMLLASERRNGTYTTATQEQLDNVARIILEAVSTQTNAFRAPSSKNTLTVPVTFDEGNENFMMNMIPPKYRSYVEPGYLQFRAYNLTGYPNALCPGVKVDTISPEYTCIGGLSDDTTAHGTCGDFAGWAGNSSDNILTVQSSGSAHSHKDIFSTILILYR